MATLPVHGPLPESISTKLAASCHTSPSESLLGNDFLKSKELVNLSGPSILVMSTSWRKIFVHLSLNHWIPIHEVIPTLEYQSFYVWVLICSSNTLWESTLHGNGHRSWCLIHPCMYVSDSDMWVMYLYHACIYTDKNLRYSRRSLFLFFWPLVALCHIGFCIQDFAIYSIGLFGPICEPGPRWALGEHSCRPRSDHPRSPGCVYGKFLFVYM